MGGGVFIGKVVSNRMQKTVVVAVSYVVWVPKYKVYERRVARHMAHDEQQECVVGDIVKIRTAGRKLSRHKSYYVDKVLRPMHVHSQQQAAAAAEARAAAGTPTTVEAAQARLEAAQQQLQRLREAYGQMLQGPGSAAAPSALSTAGSGKARAGSARSFSTASLAGHGGAEQLQGSGLAGKVLAAVGLLARGPALAWS